MAKLRAVKQMRDISFCLSLAKLIKAHADDGEYSPDINDLLVAKLTTLDARKGGREKGEGAALTPVAAVASIAKAKAGARRR